MRFFIDLGDRAWPIGFDSALVNLFLSRQIELVKVTNSDLAEVLIVDANRKLPSWRDNEKSHDWSKLSELCLYIVYRDNSPKTVYPPLVHRVTSLGWRVLQPLVLGQKSVLESKRR